MSIFALHGDFFDFIFFKNTLGIVDCPAVLRKKAEMFLQEHCKRTHPSGRTGAIVRIA
jgi:hypothetical protein